MRGFPEHHFYGPRPFFGGLGLLLMLLILGLLVYLVMQVRRGSDRTTAVATGTDTPPADRPGLLTPAEVIRMRYARGEITREDYETMRKDLE